jgi:hypothetical protein
MTTEAELSRRLHSLEAARKEAETARQRYRKALGSPFCVASVTAACEYAHKADLLETLSVDYTDAVMAWQAAEIYKETMDAHSS